MFSTLPVLITESTKQIWERELQVILNVKNLCWNDFVLVSISSQLTQCKLFLHWFYGKYTLMSQHITPHIAQHKIYSLTIIQQIKGKRTTTLT